MPSKHYCDGDCGKELNGSMTDVMIRRAGSSRWQRHSLCEDCARRNVFVIDKNGRSVSESGFASDVLR